MKKLVFSFLILPIISSVVVLNTSNWAFAHTFSGDESATFLAVVEMIKTEAYLAQQNLGTNVTLSNEHAEATTEHLDANQTKEITERNKRIANELNDSLTALMEVFNSTSPPTAAEVKDKVANIDAVLGEVVSVRIDKSQLDNVTVEALTINDLVGETLEHYAEAVGHEEINKTSQTNNAANTSANPSAREVANYSMSPVGGNASSSRVQVVNEAAYQTARALSSRVVELYKDIKSNASNSTAAENARSGLDTLKNDIDKKIPFDSIDGLIDDTITPALNSGYDLKLKMEES